MCELVYFQVVPTFLAWTRTRHQKLSITCVSLVRRVTSVIWRSNKANIQPGEGNTATHRVIKFKCIHFTWNDLCIQQDQTSSTYYPIFKSLCYLVSYLFSQPIRNLNYYFMKTANIPVYGNIFNKSTKLKTLYLAHTDYRHENHLYLLTDAFRSRQKFTDQ